MRFVARYAVLSLLMSVALLVLPCASFGSYWARADVSSPAPHSDLTAQAGAIAPSTSAPRVAGTLEAPGVPEGFPQPAAEYAPGELIVKFRSKPKLDPSRLADPGYLARVPQLKGIAGKHKLRLMGTVFGKFDPEKVKRRFHQRATRARAGETPPDLSRIYKIILEDASVSVLDVCAELRENPDIEFAEPNYVARIQMVPNDPYYSSSGTWGQAYDDLWGIKKINCAAAWDTSLGDGVVVAVIDTGLDYNHEDIAANVWVNTAEDINTNGKFDNWPSTEQRGGVYGDLDGIDNDANGKVDDVIGWDFCTYGGNVPDNNPMDDMGHGTHVSGTIAAVGNNGLGVIGVAPHAKIMPVRGLNSQGYGYNDDLAGCLTYAADNGADVVNCSWIGYHSNTLSSAVSYATSLGCVVVAAAGNDSFSLSVTYRRYPAAYENVVAVAATDCLDRKASFSNFGVTCDVAAPGVDILSLRAANTDMYIGSPGYSPGQNFVPAYHPNAVYYRANGTSMSCPHISGEAALILSLHPGFSTTAVEKVIRLKANGYTSSKFIGTGRVDASDALTVNTPTVAEAEIASPPEDTYVFHNGAVTGTATGLLYTLELGLNAYPTEWTVLASGGPVSDGTLGLFDATGKTDGHYVCKLASDDVLAFATFFYDANLLPGFPYTATFGPSGPPIPADLDGDGRDEVLYTDALYLYVVQNGGTCRPGFPKSLHAVGGLDLYLSYAGPAAGDILGDGRKEIIVVGKTSDATSPIRWEVQAFDSAGTKLWTYDRTDETFVGAYAPPMIDDIDSSGTTEVIAFSAGARSTANEGKVFAYALNGNGTMLWRTTIDAPSAQTYRAALGDIDGDGEKEIVLTYTMDENHDGWTDNAKVVVLSASGTILFEVVPMDHGLCGAALALADVTDDGRPDILYAPWSFPQGGRVYCYDGQGNDLWVSDQVAGPIFALSPGDVNADGYLEVVVRSYSANDTQSSLNNNVYVLDHRGAIVASWPDQRRGWVQLSGWCPRAAVADVDGDTAAEIVASGYAWEGNGSLVPGFPKLTYGEPWDAQTSGQHYLMSWSPAVGRLDSAGRLDVLTLVDYQDRARLFAWEFATPYNDLGAEWPMSAHDAGNTNCYMSPSVPPVRPTFSPDAGVYASSQSVTIRCATAGAKIHYTTNGFNPTIGDPIIRSGSSVLLDRSLTLKTRAWTYDWLSSEMKTASYTIAETVTVADAKKKQDGDAVNFEGAVVTAAFPGFLYVESDNRVSGIRVEKADHGLQQDWLADVTGRVKTNANGERFIEAAIATHNGNNTLVVHPLGMPNLALGGSGFLDSVTGFGQHGVLGGVGPNNIGLLVRTWGRLVGVEPVTPPATPTWFKIDDGSKVNAKCLLPAGVEVNPSWTYLGVTGISSCEKVGTELHRLIRVRTLSDITSY